MSDASARVAALDEVAPWPSRLDTRYKGVDFAAPFRGRPALSQRFGRDHGNVDAWLDTIGGETEVARLLEVIALRPGVIAYTNGLLSLERFGRTPTVLLEPRGGIAEGAPIPARRAVVLSLLRLRSPHGARELLAHVRADFYGVLPRCRWNPSGRVSCHVNVVTGLVAAAALEGSRERLARSVAEVLEGERRIFARAQADGLTAPPYRRRRRRPCLGGR